MPVTPRNYLHVPPVLPAEKTPLYPFHCFHNLFGLSGGQKIPTILPGFDPWPYELDATLRVFTTHQKKYM